MWQFVSAKCETDYIFLFRWVYQCRRMAFCTLETQSCWWTLEVENMTSVALVFLASLPTAVILHHRQIQSPTFSGPSKWGDLTAWPLVLETPLLLQGIAHAHSNVLNRTHIVADLLCHMWSVIQCWWDLRWRGAQVRSKLCPENYCRLRRRGKQANGMYAQFFCNCWFWIPSLNILCSTPHSCSLPVITEHFWSVLRSLDYRSWA